MNTLVAYDSSSDEESTVTEQKQTNVATLVTIPGIVANDSVLLPVEATETPLVGPSIPEDIAQSYDGYEQGFLNESIASERDTIRYLTQPTHPMTEMPPSPPGSPDAASASRLKHFLQLKAKGVHFNEDLCSKSAFKNPSILQTLMDRAGISHVAACRTSLPLHVFDPGSFPDEAYKEALFDSQKSLRSRVEAEKKFLSAAGKRVIDFTSGGISNNSSTASSPGHAQKRSKR